MTQEIDNIFGATNHFCKWLVENEYIIISTVLANNYRHRLITAERNEIEQTYYLVYKRDPYYSFKQGYGESVNEIIIDKLIEKNTDWVIFCNKLGKLYKIRPNKFKEIGIRKMVEIQDKVIVNGHQKIIHEVILTVSLHNLKRINNGV